MNFHEELCEDALMNAVNNGIINIASINQAYEMKRREEILSECHHFSIYQGKDGKWYTYYQDEGGKGRVKIKKNTKEDVENVLYKIYKERIEAFRIENVFEEWIDYKSEEDNLKIQSVTKYKNCFARFFTNNSDATGINQVLFRNIDEDLLESFIRKTIIHMSLTKKSYDSLRTILLGMFKYAKRKKYTNISITHFFGDLDLSKTIFTIRLKNPEMEIFSEDEVKMILDYLRPLDDIRDLAIHFLFGTGIRVGELSSLKKEDVNLAEQAITIQRTEVNAP